MEKDLAIDNAQLAKIISVDDIVDRAELSLNEEAYKYSISFMGTEATTNFWHNALMSIICGKDYPSFLKLFDYMYVNEKNNLFNFVKYEFDGYHYARDHTFDTFVSQFPEKPLDRFVNLCQIFSEETILSGQSRHPRISSILLKKDMQEELKETTFAFSPKKAM